MGYACLSRWKWFVLSVAICIVAAILYIKTTAPTYIRSTSVLLLNSGSKEANYAEIDLEALGLQTPNTSLQNEMEMLHSPVIMEQVVHELSLDVEYAYQGIFFNKILYGAEVPVKVVFSDESANGKQFTVKMLDMKNIIIKDFNKPGYEKTEIKGTLNSKIQTPCGEIIVTPTPTYNPNSKFKQEIRISKYQPSVAAERFLGNLKVENKDAKSSVVNVSITDQNTSRAEEILNKLMKAYDENWKNIQNRIAENTSQFLEERIKEIGAELGNVDNSIASYKGKNLMPDAGAAQSMYMSQSSNTQASIQNYNTQLSLLRYVRSYLLGNMGSNRPLPANNGIEDAALSGLISNYNTMQMQRNEMVVYAGDEHPKVRDFDRQLETLRKSIIESIDQSMTTIQKRMSGLQNVAGQAAGKIITSTQQEKRVASSERDQKVKETLYIFLLQEKEKTDMTINHSISNIRVIKKAGGSMAPIAPLKKQIILMSLVIGLGVPFIIIFLLEISDTKIHSRKDLEKLKAPFIGEIPLAEDAIQNRFTNILKKHRKTRHSAKIEIYVNNNGHDIINEGFRMVRTNLEFMLRKDPSRKVLLLTSANPASGKSFISANMAKSFAFLGKKILIIDLDMRRCTVSSLVCDHHMHGLANYLGHYNDDINDIICHDAIHEGVDIIPVGTIPPNPTELLHDKRLGELISKVRDMYDYIFIDCPPIDIIADTDIVSQFVDTTIFVIRAGLMERSWLSDINKIYEEQRFNNLSIMLNGTLAGNAYSRHRYGGYYGHYHYGYYYGSKSKKM